jgi:hypothetical protein
MFDPRTKLSEQVVQEVQRYFGELVYGVIIPRTVRLSEAPGFGQPITVYDAKSKGAEAYRQLAREVALRPPPDTPMPSFEDISVPVMVPREEVVNLEESRAGNGARSTEPAGGAEALDRRARPMKASVEAPDEPLPIAEPEPDVEASGAEAHSEVEAPPGPATASVSQGRDEDLWQEPPPEPEPRVKPLSRPPPPGELPERRVVVIDEKPDLDVETSPDEAPPPGSQEGERPGMADIGATLDAEKGKKRRWRLFRRGGD